MSLDSYHVCSIFLVPQLLRQSVPGVDEFCVGFLYIFDSYGFAFVYPALGVGFCVLVVCKLLSTLLTYVMGELFGMLPRPVFGTGKYLLMAVVYVGRSENY